MQKINTGVGGQLASPPLLPAELGLMLTL